MPRVGIVTDTGNCLPPEFIREYDIRVAPINVIVNGKTYCDGVDITPDEFYKLQKDPKNTSSTSGIAPGTFMDIFKDLARSTDKILCLPHSSDLGVTYNSLMQAREMAKQELADTIIEVVDTRTVVGAQGMMVLEAARAAHADKSLSEIIETVQDMIPRVKWLMALETLTYLIKGGRAPKFAGTLANLIQMKPVIGMMNLTGILDFSDRVRTTPKAMARLIEITLRYALPDKPAHIIVHYSDDLSKGEKLKEMLAAEFNCAELYMSQVTPMVSCQTGPMVGLSFYF
ncbi:MAG: DegV family protein [Dehalococcoidia bacterium]|nr:DegV family protein [Dehalococcoidia bacterium]